MNTLEVTKERAITAHENATQKGKALLEDLFGKKTFLKSITERVKTFDDVLIELQISKDQFEEECEGLSVDEIAYRQLKLIAKALNEGWVPDWTNGQWDKYIAWFKMGDTSGSGFSYGGYDGWITASNVGSRLCFKSAELAKYAGNQFTEIFKNFMIIGS